jgi:hypothetical protein
MKSEALLKRDVPVSARRFKEPNGGTLLVVIEFAVTLVTNQNDVVLKGFLDEKMEFGLGNDGARGVSRRANEEHLTALPIVVRQYAVVGEVTRGVGCRNKQGLNISKQCCALVDLVKRVGYDNSTPAIRCHKRLCNGK